MARPRTPANVLELRGSFKTHPERRREDVSGAGPLAEEPPIELTGEEQAAWRRIIVRLPRVALTATEELGIAQMARILAAMNKLTPTSSDFKKLDDSFRQWAVQMGLTLQARLKLGASGNKDTSNRFDKFKEPAA